MTKDTVEFRGDSIQLTDIISIQLDRVWSIMDEGFYNVWNVLMYSEIVISYPIYDYSLQDVVDNTKDMFYDHFIDK